MRATGGEVPHPAWIIREWLAAHEQRQVWLAERIGSSTKHVNQILRGRALWSPAMAARIEQVTGIPALTLMQLKAEYELDHTGNDRDRS